MSKEGSTFLSKMERASKILETFKPFVETLIGVVILAAVIFIMSEIHNDRDRPRQFNVTYNQYYVEGRTYWSRPSVVGMTLERSIPLLNEDAAEREFDYEVEVSGVDSMAELVDSVVFELVRDNFSDPKVLRRVKQTPCKECNK